MALPGGRVRLVQQDSKVPVELPELLEQQDLLVELEPQEQRDPQALQDRLVEPGQPGLQVLLVYKDPQDQQEQQE